MPAGLTKLVYFSPTETTKKVLQGIACGIGSSEPDHINLTPPSAKKRAHDSFDEQLVLVGAPVYGGRIPIAAAERLSRLTGKNTPAVVVVVYGNRAYEDALLELKDLVEASGFKAIAGAAFIGEHSFSTTGTPLAIARPDEHDLRIAVEFGKLVSDKLAGLAALDQSSPLQLPGSYPYKPQMEPSGIAPITDDAPCARCETCVGVCPMGAVTALHRIETDADACILCCACVKNCPTGARVMHDEGIHGMMKLLFEHHSERKAPELFL